VGIAGRYSFVQMFNESSSTLRENE